MSSLKAQCPSCAASIEFQKGSTIVTVCPFCRAAVARTDRGFEDLGKAAEITDSLSPLELGLHGVWRGQSFELTGRIRKLHELGGFWDEWYATFSNGWVGWLAEAQGRFYLTFNQVIEPGHRVPAFDEIYLGQQLTEIPSETPLMVAEKGTGTAQAAEGEIPFKFVPGEQWDYADLSGENNACGTIDYGQTPPQVLVGWQLTLAELGLRDAAPKRKSEARVVDTAAMQCPNCAAPLELVAPDQSQRVACSHCDSLIDVDQGKLRFLNALKPEQKFYYDLALGAEGVFERFEGGAKFRLIGAMTRSVSFDQKYFWKEYLLYNPRIGFRWLVQSDDHWSFVEPVNLADVYEAPDSDLFVSYRETSFRVYQEATATVEYVTGEFYWRVEQGETVKAVDYVAPPLMLSKETADKEINWSLGTFITKEEVEKAFGVTGLFGSTYIAPNQPFRHNALIRAGLVVLLGAIVLFAVSGILFSGKSSKPPPDFEQIFTLSPKSSADEKTVVFSAPLRLEKGTERNFYISSDLDYETWSEFDVTMVPADPESNKNDSGQVKSEEPASPRWESRNVWRSKMDQAVETGDYQIRAEGRWQNWEKPSALKFRLSQYYRSEVSAEVWLTLLFCLMPLLMLLYKAYFEGRRWENGNMPRPFFLERIFSGVLSGK